MKKTLKSIIKFFIIIVFICACIYVVLYVKNYLTYKKMISIISDSKEKVSNIKNVSIEIDYWLNNEYFETNGNKIVIKDSLQCDTNDRKYAEENHMDYRIMDFEEKICYTISPQYEDKKVYIRRIENEYIYTIELLELVQIHEIKFINSYKYDIKDEKIDEMDSYKLTLYNNNEEFYEYNYWISKENGLLLKEEHFVSTLDSNENTKHTSVYKYTFNDVTDEDVKSIDLKEYSDYKIIDNR